MSTNQHDKRDLPKARYERAGGWCFIRIDDVIIYEVRHWNTARSICDRINTAVHNHFAPNRRAND